MNKLFKKSLVIFGALAVMATVSTTANRVFIGPNSLVVSPSAIASSSLIRR